MRDLLDVEPARGDVGGHENLQLAVLERRQRFEARGLCLVAVDCRRFQAILFELARKPRCAMLGAHEAQHLPDVARADDMGQQRALRVLRHLVRGLHDGLGGGVASRNFDQRRLVQELIGELLDLVAECRREQQVLSFVRGRKQPHDPLDVGDESHVEHSIRFIENQDLDLAEVHALLLDVIEHPAGRGDKDLDAGAHDRQLLLDVDAAEHAG